MRTFEVSRVVYHADGSPEVVGADYVPGPGEGISWAVYMRDGSPPLAQFLREFPTQPEAELWAMHRRIEDANRLEYDKAERAADVAAFAALRKENT